MLRRAVAVALLAGAVTVLGPAPRAEAVVTGLVRVAPNTAETSDAKTLTATCPAGTRVLSAGVDTTPGNGRVVVDRVRPNATLTSVSLRANEDEVGTAAAWYLQAFVVCADAPAGLELATATSGATSAAKAVTASCPAGKKLLGTGAEVDGPKGQVLLDGIVPNGALTKLTVNAVEDETGTTATWTVTAHAICAAPVTALQRVVATSPSSSSPDRLVTAPCPAGTALVGMGGEIDSPNGQVVVDALYQDGDLTFAGFGASEDGTGNDASWSVTAYAVCAARGVVVEDSGESVSGGDSVGSRTCAAGLRSTLLGVELELGRGRLGLSGLVPQADPSRAEFTSASATADQPPFLWGYRRRLLCLSPPAGLERVALSNNPSGAHTQSLTVACPAGKRVIGLGGKQPGTFSERWFLQGLVPNAGLTQATVTMTEGEDAGTQDWGVNVQAVCAPAPAGLQLVTAVGPTRSREYAETTASCPAGKQVVGAGAAITGGDGEVLLNGLMPEADLTSVTASAYEDPTGYPASWSLTAHAICMNR